MPMAITSYFFLSIAFAILRADTSEISCSADLPPNSRATRSFFFIWELFLNWIKDGK